MPVFPSRDWMESFCAHLQAHPHADDFSQALEGVYRFVVEPAGSLTERHSYDVAIAPGDDLRGPSVVLLDGDSASPRLSLTANHDRWRELIEGRLDVGMAVMLRRLKVSGDLSGIMSRLDSARPLLEALRQVDTDWR